MRHILVLTFAGFNQVFHGMAVKGHGSAHSVMQVLKKG